MKSTFWTDGYRDGLNGAPYSPPEHSATSVYTAEYQRGYNAACEEVIERSRSRYIAKYYTGNRIKPFFESSACDTREEAAAVLFEVCRKAKRVTTARATFVDGRWQDFGFDIREHRRDSAA